MQHTTSPKIPKKNKPLRKNLFGREDLAECYRKAKDLFFRHELWHVAKLEESESGKVLSICNLWQVRQDTAGNVRTFEFCLKKERWEEVRRFTERWGNDGSKWPYIPLVPIKWCTSTYWAIELLYEVVDRTLECTDFESIPDIPENEDTSENKDHPVMPKHRLRRLLQDRLFFKNPYVSKKSPVALCLNLSHIIFKHFLDKEVVSAIMAINPCRVTFTRYLEYARSAEGIRKVARERRNLLPLLLRINPNAWNRDDLFSRKLWVRDGRAWTALDRAPIGGENVCVETAPSTVRCMVPDVQARLESFEHRCGWRWLSRAPLTVVATWATWPDAKLATNIALANVPEKAPAAAYIQLLRAFDDRFCISKQVQNCIRIFLLTAAKIWKEQGLDSVRRWLKEADLVRIAEWLEDEGLSQGLPKKNATWASLDRTAEEWDRRTLPERNRILWEQRLEEEREERERERRERAKKIKEEWGTPNPSWKSLVPKTEVHGFVFTPLEDALALDREGEEMAHCAGEWIEDCLVYGYRLFSAINKEENLRYTVSIRPCVCHGVEVDQVKARCNLIDDGIDKAIEAAEKIAAMYEKAMAESERKSKKK